MRVLFVTAVFENEATGAARFAKLIHKYGRDNYTILTEDSKGGEGIVHLNISPKWYEVKLWQYFRIRHYRNKLKALESEYDVFLFNNTLLADGFVTSKPTFVFIHDDKLVDPKPSFRFDYIRRLILGKVEKRVLESGKSIVANSKYIAKKFSKHFDIAEKNLLTMYQGIEINNQKKNMDFLGGQSIIKVMFVKNDYHRGGLMDLYDALMLLENYQFDLHVVGPINLYLNIFPSSRNVNCIIHGSIPNTKVLELMQECDMFCLPTKEEPLGVAIMEALATGLPTITTGVGGLPEVTNYGKLIWECIPGNKKSIAEQIENCINSPDERKEKSYAGVKFIRDNFDFNKVLHRLEDIIKSSET